MQAFLRRYSLPLVVLTAGALLTGCTSDGHLSVFGYTSAPPYNCDIHTVYVAIAKNKTMRQGLQNEITRALIREVKLKTPYKVVDSPHGADSELVLTVVNQTKKIITLNQIGGTREAELSMSVEVLWRDLRPGHEGELLSGSGAGQNPNAKKRDGNGPMAMADEKPKPDEKQKGIIITPTTNYIPELGMSNASAEQALANQLAFQIVQMMEVWK